MATLKIIAKEKINDDATDTPGDLSEKDMSARDREFEEKRRIMREHLDVFPDHSDSKDNKYNDGLTLYVSPEDDDDVHIEHHAKFLKEHGSALTMRGKTKLENHIEKHSMSKMMKEEMFGGHLKMIRKKLNKDLPDF